MVTHEFRRFVEVRAALADPSLVPLPAETGPPGTMAWLRHSVARFCAGDVHARRRVLVVDELASLDPAALRCGMRQEMEPASASDLGRLVVRTLAEAMRLPDPPAVAEAIHAMAGAYFGGADANADRACAWLTEQLGGATEVVANRIGLLIQACDATAALIDNARRAGASALASADGPSPEPPDDVLALVIETVRHDPPVRVMRRIAVADTIIAGQPIAAGDLVLLDIAAANRDPDQYPEPDAFRPGRRDADALTFGAPPRTCPGREHALAIAAGALDRKGAP
jgi:cytochrome P450